MTVREEISAAQYDSPANADTWELSGTVLCRAELDGVPDVTVAIVPGPFGNMTGLGRLARRGARAARTRAHRGGASQRWRCTRACRQRISSRHARSSSRRRRRRLRCATTA